MLRQFVGDLHGNKEALDNAIEKLDFSPFNEIYFIGDYIDRGTNSLYVINKVKELTETYPNVKAVLGNHERLLLDFIFLFDVTYLEENPKLEFISEIYGENVYYDGISKVYNTLNKDVIDDIRNELCLHPLIKWLYTQVKEKYITDTEIITHANYLTDKEDSLSDTDILLFSRPNIYRKNETGKKVIVGHTSTNTWHNSEKQPDIYFSDNDFIMIDTENYLYGKSNILVYDSEKDNYFQI